MTDREFALSVVRTLQSAGFTALWAGGCVRDEFLGLVPEDYDVATSARPEQLRPLFRRRNEIGAHFGVVQVIGPKKADGTWHTIEVASFRSDGAYTDGRRPDTVTFSTPEEDAQRRDFTVNGMFFDPVRNELLDFVGGRADLDAKVLRAIGDPFARFTEDKLRILRAARMATRFGLAIDPTTRDAAQQMAPQVSVVSAERVAEELRKLFAHPNRTRGLALLRELGLIEPILPELTPSADRASAALAALSEVGGRLPFPLAFAVTLHAVGRAVTERVAERLKLSNVESDRLCWLVANQSVLTDAEVMRPSKLKPLLVHPGIDDLLALHRALATATGGSLAPVEFCTRVLRDTPPEELNPPPVLTGADLIARGLKPGPAFKRLLDAVREAQLEGRAATKEQGHALVTRLLAEPGDAPEPPPG
ncbi:tRNA nucleotidyltransferase/poly(A) polymerase [Gemmata obscuriglobus]|uniref:CCA tRNA nucleotidyltransferase n=1 Tax=Gemmata obscuriglobus TaxID=114 RepID=A0A2Z3HCD5_9BACT|nr:CCA tRNA nucleotidyltransferase [Gemmata obscuriglobus]QEG28098.1 tRNA nucleotidyltransferase/poly(A) polymerase [Gemmata obscuriglobus]VTS05729.1 trna adenylyltransferase : tRNA nucleotidyltransferase/poly(A) polymerase OS=Singulisphaera acidiphila (strain ATCC BAA-1392 / DSM 18658 / VKM B-2454 / MOB10) GN=Sinac_5938 PE=3 SV=1: PolyA_pol: PolyA_pol_RNAbd [Gemmata obscuriglobus UQM 2246]